MRAFCGFVPCAMGTKLDFVILDIDIGPAQEIWNSALKELRTLESMLDRFNPLSEVSAINASQGKAKAGGELSSIISLCGDYRSKTGGLFDIRVGGELDFGGFAKGYFIQKCLAILRDAAVTDAFVNFGNSTILGLGKSPAGESWAVDIIDPYSGNPLDRIILDDATLSTSGNTPLYSGHTIDPRTGKGVEERRLVAAVSPDPLEAEVLSTTVMAGGPDSVPALREAFPNTRLKTYSL